MISGSQDTPGTKAIGARPRLDSGMKDNKRFLRAVFPKVGTSPEQVVDLSFLLAVPNLCNAFAEAFLSHCARNRLRTRSSLASSLRGGFIRYLSDLKLTNIALSELHNRLITSFVGWLNGQRLKDITRRTYLSALRGLFEALHRSSKWNAMISPDLAIPRCCWPLGTRRGTPTETLTDEDRNKLYNACLSEMKETMLQVSSAQRLLSEGRSQLPEYPSTFRDYSELSTCLAALDKAFADSPPSFNQLDSRSPFLRAAISKLHGGLIKVRSFLYPDPRILTPFALFLAFHTGFNPDVVLTLSLGDFSTIKVLGQSHLRFDAYKPRARERQVVDIPVTEDSDNPSNVVDFLVQWGARIRKSAPSHLSKYLFLFLPRTNHTTAMAFSDPKKGGGGQITWHNCIHEFCADYGLKQVTLRQIRATVLDLNMAIHGGDIRAAKAFGNQKSVETIYSHYSSDAQRQRNLEKLAELTQQMVRWVDTSGLIDPRKLPLDVQKEAATPGWGCFDPFSSPFSEHGSLCTAYGLCPNCPLAHLDLTSSYSCAQTHNLLDAILRAQFTLDPDAWLARWAPVVGKLLSVWLPRFPDAVREEAKVRFSTLPALPSPD
jgi:hypothetical protein